MKAVAAVSVAALLLTFAAGAAVYRMGAVRITVHEKRANGVSLSLVVPAALLRLALAFVPDSELREPGDRTGAWWPMIGAACSQLERSPDGTFVQVESRTESVNIAKKGGALVIEVDDEGETVHLSVPLGSLHWLASRLERARLGTWKAGMEAVVVQTD